LSQKERYTELTSKYSLPVFFQPWWLDAVSKNWDVAIAERKGKPVAVWPYTIEKKMGVRILRNPSFTPYLGPCALQDSWLEKTVLEELWSKLPAWDVCDVMLLPGLNLKTFFEEQGFSCREKTTYILDLDKTEQELFKNIKDSRRSIIRKAEKELTVNKGVDGTDRFYEFHKMTYQLKNVKYPFRKKLFKGLIGETTGHNQGAVLSAKTNFPHAFAFTPYDKESMYLLLTAKDAIKSHTGAASLLVWEAIKEAKRLGLRRFDFEGSSDAGIATFFRSFGGEKYSYLHCWQNKSALWKLKSRLLG
jgi:hypothetical protein